MQPRRRPKTAVRLTLQSPLYRGATIAMFLSGLGFSAAAPQIASFLVNELHASLTTAGLYYLTSLTAPVAGYLVGSRSDRTGRRLGLFRLCAVAGFLGWTGIAVSHQLWMPFVISAALLGFAGAATSQLFAALHDDLAANPRPNNDGVVNLVRMALTAGWVIGPAAGAFLAAQTNPRVLLFATAICTLAQIVPLGRLNTSSAHLPTDDTPRETRAGRRPAPNLRQMTLLLIFTTLYICVYAGESIKYAYLPIYMNRDLGLAPALSGTVIGIQPLVELVLMPVAVIVAQRLLPTAVATASAIFLSSTALSSAIGGLVGGLGAGTVGLPSVFLIPAAFSLAAAVGLAIMAPRAGL